MRAATVILATLLVLPASLPAVARPVWTTGTFVYADLCTNPDAGRLEGRRVTVKRSPNGDGVLYEAAAGSAVTPVPAEVVSIDDGSQQIAFTIESEAGPMRFQGTAAADALAGTLSDGSGDRPLRLRRVLRSHEREACRTGQQDPDTTGSTN